MLCNFCGKTPATRTMRLYRVVTPYPLNDWYKVRRLIKRTQACEGCALAASKTNDPYTGDWQAGERL